MMKRGQFECEAIRSWMKRQHCAAPGCVQSADDPHHFPTRGAGGDDFGVVPLCRPCHTRAHSGELSREWQERAAGDALVRFLRHANELERKAFVCAWERYIAERVFIEVPA